MNLADLKTKFENYQEQETLFCSYNKIASEKSIVFHFNEYDPIVKKTIPRTLKLPLQDAPISLNVSSTWDDVFNGGTMEAGNVIASRISSLLGTDFTSDAMKTINENIKNANAQQIREAYMRKYWRGSRWSTISFDFHLIALSDPKEEVIKPLQTLSAIIAPSSGEENRSINFQNIIDIPIIFVQKAEKVYGKLTGQKTDTVLSSPAVCSSITVGGYLKFNSCAITGCSMEFSNDLDEHGYPLECTGRISFVPIEPPSSYYVQKILNGAK